MILVILGVCLFIAAAGFITIVVSSYDNDLAEMAGAGGIVVGGIGSIISIIVIICLSVAVSKSGVIDERIAMYAEENTNIEQQIAMIVNEYKQYESDTLTDLKPESMILLTTIYPELKTNELVNSQLAIHIENHEKIKRLKEEKICADVYRWWLYFGGRDTK